MSDLNGDHREAAFVAADPDRTPQASRWAELIQKINDLTESRTHYVTQVHTRDPQGNRAPIYETHTGTAAVFWNQETDFLVTSDGKKHPV